MVIVRCVRASPVPGSVNDCTSISAELQLAPHERCQIFQV